MDLDERVIRRLQARLRPENGCLVYTGIRPGDYGRLVVNGHRVLAHRVAWIAVHGPIPDGMLVCHHCDNPPCCNVDHLFLGDNSANIRDAVQKGRIALPTNGPDFFRNKTHCPKGHPYSGDNVRYRPSGSRRCAQCYRIRSAAYAKRNRATINARKRERRKVQQHESA